MSTVFFVCFFCLLFVCAAINKVINFLEVLLLLTYLVLYKLLVGFE